MKTLFKAIVIFLIMMTVLALIPLLIGLYYDKEMMAWVYAIYCLVGIFYACYQIAKTMED